MQTLPLPSHESERPVVLVVDDAPSSLGMLCDTLEASGYTVLVAADGEAALQRLELVVPDAILLDGLMPGLSGFETCRRIKANPAWAHIPVLFMTGLSETSHVVEGFECGGVDYVVKPIRAQEVLARLHTHARNARITRMARDAVDVAGMGVVFVDTRGRIAWRSPQAALWLHALEDPVSPGLLPQSLEAALVAGAAIVIGTATGMRLSVRNLGAAALGETMLLFAMQRDGTAGASSARLAEAALTPRETEVLSWLAKGKTNRDIGEILGTSPRTVNKHLEHIFEKLGVETRAAAAALASGQLA
ncbi:DNA-binding NarL/FixJ family response regulator [Variovorax boronicumulans]|jgi:DNA-binding NarL/FixJ family response regulator|uniref:DNA-binding NarL/FixJ family response regulator n=1 Tax=Variovorax boronicumulans TaxID=436515 RepID=A0AAW8D270_9BURK|nr:response regulator transcription factor [Variovorax boronicumulans]MDP9897703.1 DNA-binding NarL/FixJ family response regulator [Variovorax boronicumulans]MDP9996364.1 DNA-binding NarL/FixJ family response regulator [Variovorax boronicumulans]MDQ0007614.1 DNA-binding NarL/FixJ family response regulator [Variovorax boronicumulans]MDQ0039416.1 DNA-binding NarL/FixJ family response regulator [Variovorax boronicumulans]MDQ0057778.1 DNA-binding NarL/FixJ family response regulator [Variovorax bor